MSVQSCAQKRVLPQNANFVRNLTYRKRTFPTSQLSPLGQGAPLVIWGSCKELRNVLSIDAKQDPSDGMSRRQIRLTVSSQYIRRFSILYVSIKQPYGHDCM